MAERFALAGRVPLADLYPGAPAAIAPEPVGALARLGHARAGDLCFCDRLEDPAASALAAGAFVLCPPSLQAELRRRFPEAICLPAPDARAQFIDIADALSRRGALEVSDAIARPFGVHPGASVGAGTVIHPQARIDEGACIGSHCTIRRGTWIRSGAQVHDHVAIGVAGINAYPGADGRVRSFPHLAGVIVGRRSQIGAGSVLVQGILTSTRIGDDCVIGNLSNLGHGAELGDGVWMSVGVLVGGHARIGAGAALGMGAALRDNVALGAGAQVGMGSVVVRSVGEGVSVFGNPARTVPTIEAGPARTRRTEGQ